MKISLDALTVIDAIVREGSYQGAADALYKVRSALTYTVNKLEADLGVTIFTIQGKKAVLTAVGKVVLDEGRKLLEDAAAVEYRINQAAAGWESELKIAYDETLFLPAVIKLAAQFYQECPRMNLRFLAEILNGSWDALETGRADLAIGVSGDTLNQQTFGIMPLGVIPFVFVVSPSHPLALIDRVITNEELKHAISIAAADSSLSLKARTSGTLSNQTVMTVSSLAIKLHAQLAAIGAGFLPFHLVEPYVIAGQLLIKEVEKPKPPVRLSVAWNVNCKGKAFGWFMDKLADKHWQEALLGINKDGGFI